MNSTTIATPARRLRAPKLGRFIWLGVFMVLLGVGGWRLWETYRLISLPGQPATEAAIAEKWGIKITHIAVLADGGLIDFRFQVLDPDKSAALFDLPTRPLLYVEKTGQLVDSLYHPPHGHNIIAGQSQYFIYNNAHGAIQRGSLVAVVLGDLRLEHIVAQ